MLLKTVNEFKDIIENKDGVFIYFSSPSCNVCHSLKPKMFEYAKENYPKLSLYEVDISLSLEIAANCNVLTAPTAIIFLDKKEFVRDSRAFSVEGFFSKIDRPYSLFFG